MNPHTITEFTSLFQLEVPPPALDHVNGFDTMQPWWQTLACHTKSVQRDVWAVHEETGTGRLQTQVMGPHANAWQAVAEGNAIVPQADCCIVQLHCHFVSTTLLSMFWKDHLLYLYHIVNGHHCYYIATALYTMLLPCFDSARGHFFPPQTTTILCGENTINGFTMQ